MKDSLIEINNLQGHNSRVDETQIQINDMEHQKAKNNQEEKRILKKQGKDKQPLGQPQGDQHLHHRGVRTRRERARNWKPF